MKAVLLTISIISLLLSSCQRKENSGKRMVSASICPLAYLAQEIAGDGFEVATIVPKGASPESYDPSPRELVGISRSEAVIMAGGLGFEMQWKDRLMEHAPRAVFADCSTGIEKIYGGDRHGHEAFDPHTWTTPSNAARIAGRIAEVLSEIDKGNKDIYASRLRAITERADSVDHLIHACLDTLSCRAFAIYHPSLTYFAREYSLEQICIESEGKEPSSQDLRNTIDLCRSKGVRVIFVQQEFDGRNASLIAKETGARTVQINPLSSDLFGEMERIAKELCHE